MYTYRAHIISVYDGDTVRCDVDLGFDCWLCNRQLRLYGIDAPELRGGTRKAGLRTRDALREMVLAQTCRLRTHKDQKDKYGRYLATLFLGTLNVNEWLIQQGFAAKYVG